MYRIVSFKIEIYVKLTYLLPGCLCAKKACNSLAKFLKLTVLNLTKIKNLGGRQYR